MSRVLATSVPSRAATGGEQPAGPVSTGQAADAFAAVLEQLNPGGSGGPGGGASSGGASSGGADRGVQRAQQRLAHRPFPPPVAPDVAATPGAIVAAAIAAAAAAAHAAGVLGNAEPGAHANGSAATRHQAAAPGITPTTSTMVASVPSLDVPYPSSTRSASRHVAAPVLETGAPSRKVVMGATVVIPPAALRSGAASAVGEAGGPPARLAGGIDQSSSPASATAQPTAAARPVSDVGPTAAADARTAAKPSTVTRPSADPLPSATAQWSADSPSAPNRSTAPAPPSGPVPPEGATSVPARPSPDGPVPAGPPGAQDLAPAAPAPPAAGVQQIAAARNGPPAAQVEASAPGTAEATPRPAGPAALSPAHSGGSETTSGKQPVGASVPPGPVPAPGGPRESTYTPPPIGRAAPAAPGLDHVALATVLSRPVVTADGSFAVTARLTPPELGAVHASVELSGSAVRVVLNAASVAGHAALRDSLHQLAAELAHGGREVHLSLADHEHEPPSPQHGDTYGGSNSGAGAGGGQGGAAPGDPRGWGAGAAPGARQAPLAVPAAPATPGGSAPALAARVPGGSDLHIDLVL